MSKYIAINAKGLAYGISFITGEPYYVWDTENPEEKKYTFRRTPETEKAMEDMVSLRNKNLKK